MNDLYQFKEVSNSEAQPEFDVWLFHEWQHAVLQAAHDWRTFVITKKEAIVAQVRFHIDGNCASASIKSPFGTFQFSRDIPAENLFLFIQFCENELRISGVEKIKLKNPPVLYAAYQQDLLAVSLLNLGYQIQDAELGALLHINTSYEKKIDSWELRKLKQCEKAGLKTKRLPLEHLDAVYNFILSCREEREYELSLSFEALNSIVQSFPDRFELFVVQDKNTLTAASISIKIDNSILYNFYSAHPKKYDSMSPVVMLMKALYSYCQHEQMKLLDLGTSAIEGKPNFGLLDFKLRLGATPSPKYTFQKDF